MSKKSVDDLISIIVPIYNIENYLKACIESIINQSYRNLQIILVDDGSVDRSGEICDMYAVDDSRICVIHKENGGLVSARKAGISRAIGKYVGFVDGDDYIKKNMYQKLYDVAKKYQAEVVHSGYYSGNENKIYFTSEVIKRYTSIHDKGNLLLQLFSLNTNAEMGANIWSNLFEREFLVKYYKKVPEGQGYGEDLITMCYCVINTDNFISIPDAFYYYRKRKNSISQSISQQRLLEYYTLYDILEEILLDSNFKDSGLRALKKRFSILAMQLLAEMNHYYIPKYKYSDIESLRGKKIVLYGAGRVGKDYYYQLCLYQDCQIVTWIDQRNCHLDYATIQSADDILLKDYDIILIAVLDKNMAGEMKLQLINKGIDGEIIIWKEPISILD